MGKKVGIVIPSYNQGKFLEEAIQSVIKNRKHIDIKLIVVDGGSTDGSAAIIKKYSAEIDWWRSREDEGQANAINIGMRQCGDCVQEFFPCAHIFEAFPHFLLYKFQSVWFYVEFLDPLRLVLCTRR